jgi:hypothetical protein
MAEELILSSFTSLVRDMYAINGIVSPKIRPEAPLRHPLERDHEVGELVRALGNAKSEA